MERYVRENRIWSNFDVTPCLISLLFTFEDFLYTQKYILRDLCYSTLDFWGAVPSFAVFNVTYGT